MATILIGTEVPEGMGHVAPWLDFCNLAIEQGHTVHMAGPDLLVLQRCISSRVGVNIWAAPRVNPVRTHVSVRSWPELLVSLGYAQPEWLTGAVLSWANILDAVQPEVVLTDYAPALMGACQALGIQYVEVGGGFCVPPVNHDGSMPPFPGILSDDPAAVSGSRAALDQLSQALTQATRALGPSKVSRDRQDWAALHHHATRRLVTSPALLDHYDERDQRIAPVEHVGFMGLSTLPPHIFKTPLKDPLVLPTQEQVPKLTRFVGYLKPNTPRLREIVQSLETTGWPAQIYCPSGVITSSASVKVTQSPLELKDLLNENTVFLSNGGLASVGIALHLGATVLVAPQQAEQIALVRRLVKSGWGRAFTPWALQKELMPSRMRSIASLLKLNAMHAEDLISESILQPQ